MFRLIGKIIHKFFALAWSILAIVLAIVFVLTIIYPLGYREEIVKYSEIYDVDPFLVASVINVESNYKKDATSAKDAKGLMQITDRTGEWGASEIGIYPYGSSMLYDPDINIRIGTWYLSKLESEFNGNRDTVLAAYNAGSGNVSKWLEDGDFCQDGENLTKIPFLETDQYVKKVNSGYNTYKKLYSKQMYKTDIFSKTYFDIVINLRMFLKKISNEIR